MGVSTGSQSTEPNLDYECHTTGGVEFKKALERSQHSRQSSKSKSSNTAKEQDDEATQEEEVDADSPSRLR